MTKFLAPLALIVLASASMAQSSRVFSYDGRPEKMGMPRSGLNAQDMRYFGDATASNRFELLSSEIAFQRSRNSMVLKHAKMMVEDHKPAYEDLRLIAMRKGVRLPKGLPTWHQSVLNKLRTLRGAAFDKYYIETQIQAHQVASAATKRQIRDGMEADLKDFAIKSLPTIIEHLDHAKSHKNHM